MLLAPLESSPGECAVAMRLIGLLPPQDGLTTGMGVTSAGVASNGGEGDTAGVAG